MKVMYFEDIYKMTGKLHLKREFKREFGSIEKWEWNKNEVIAAKKLLANKKGNWIVFEDPRNTGLFVIKL